MSDETTRIKVGLGATINTGSYESVRIDIAVEDFKRQGESMDAATERIYSFVESKVEQKMQEIEKDLKRK